MSLSASRGVTEGRRVVLQLSSSFFFGFAVSLGGLQLVVVCSNSTYIERCDGWLQVIICWLITLGVLTCIERCDGGPGVVMQLSSSFFFG
jgi:hypothetical protein